MRPISASISGGRGGVCRCYPTFRGLEVLSKSGHLTTSSRACLSARLFWLGGISAVSPIT